MSGVSPPLASHVHVHRKLLTKPLVPFTPEEWVEEMRALGSDITLEQYTTILKIIGLLEHRGSCNRRPEKDVNGKFGPIPTNTETGQVLQEDNPYDPAEVALKRHLLTSFQVHINKIQCGNKWPENGFGDSENVTAEPPLLPSESGQTATGAPPKPAVISGAGPST